MLNNSALIPPRVSDRSGAYHARLSEADGTHGQEQALACQQKGNKDQSESRHDGICSSFYDLLLSYLSNARLILMLSRMLIPMHAVPANVVDPDPVGPETFFFL